MKLRMIIAACAVATTAHAQTVRLGQPLSAVVPPPPAVAVAVDLDQPPVRQASPDTTVLEITLPKASFDAGETVTLAAYLHTRGGTDIDNGTIEVEDTYSTGVLDHGTPGSRQKGHAYGKGRYTATLDNRPGEHFITVWANALDSHGNSVHRATAISYSVATGELKFLGVGGVRPAGVMLVVPLKVVAPHGGFFIVSGVLAAGQIAVARADTSVQLDAGAGTVELRFALADIVETGPYRLVNVFAHVGNEAGAALAAAPQDVGGPFQAPHADHEPAPAEPSPDFSGPPPTPFSPTPMPPGMDPVPPDPRQLQ